MMQFEGEPFVLSAFLHLPQTESLTVHHKVASLSLIFYFLMASLSQQVLLAVSSAIGRNNYRKWNPTCIQSFLNHLVKRPHPCLFFYLYYSMVTTLKNSVYHHLWFGLAVLNKILMCISTVSAFLILELNVMQAPLYTPPAAFRMNCQLAFFLTPIVCHPSKDEYTAFWLMMASLCPSIYFSSFWPRSSGHACFSCGEQKKKKNISLTVDQLLKDVTNCL